MDTWLMLLLVVAVAAAAILLLALLSSVAILGAGKRYIRKIRQQDEEKISKCLPGSDCGECGLDSCRAFAREAAEKQEFSRQCPYFPEEMQAQLQQSFDQRRATLEERLAQTKANNTK